jgi:hypothetical protein
MKSPSPARFAKHLPHSLLLDFPSFDLNLTHPTTTQQHYFNPISFCAMKFLTVLISAGLAVAGALPGSYSIKMHVPPEHTVHTGNGHATKPWPSVKPITTFPGCK